MASTKAQVDDLAHKFEKSAERLTAHKDSAVKRRAAETDVLKIVELARDLLQNAVKGDRDLLVQNFGGSCERFWRFQNVMDSVEFSDANAEDPRWQQLKDAMLAIRHVLEDLGSFKSWLINMSAPSSLKYDIPCGFLELDADVKLAPQVQGCELETLNFVVDPSLPDCLQLDAKTGEISGRLLPDYRERLQVGVPCKTVGPVIMRSGEELSSDEVAELPQGSKLTIEALGEGRRIKITCNGKIGWISSKTKSGDRLVQQACDCIYTIRASNSAGIASFDLDLSGPTPDAISYEGLPVESFSCLLGTPISWGPVVKGGLPTTWSVAPSLPEGLQLDAQTGIIFGSPASRQKPTKFEVSGTNACGSVSTALHFGVVSAEDESKDKGRNDELKEGETASTAGKDLIGRNDSLKEGETASTAGKDCEAPDEHSEDRANRGDTRTESLEDVAIESSEEAYSSDDQNRNRQGSMCTESVQHLPDPEDDEVLLAGGDPERVVRLEWRKSRRMEHNGWTSHSTLQARLGDGNFLRLERFADVGFSVSKFAKREDISDEGELYRNLTAKIHEIKRPIQITDLQRYGNAIEKQQPYSLRSANCHHFVRDLWNDCVIEPLKCRHYPDRIKGGLLRGVTKPLSLGLFNRGHFASTAKPQPGAVADDSDDELADELCQMDNKI